MDKKLILAGGVVILVAAIAAIVFSTQKSPEQSQEAATEVDVSPQDEEESVTGSILSLLQGGRNVTCTYSLETEGGTTSGTVYIAGDRMYGEFTTTVDNLQSFDSNVIRDNEYMYTWSSAVEGGTKMKIVEAEDNEAETEKDDTTKSLEQDVDMKCNSWTADNSKFIPPGDIEFTDLTSDVEKIDKMIQGVKDNNPADICSQFPAPAQQQCLDALNNSN